MKLSPHFTLEEMTTAEVAVRNGWENYPDPLALDNLRRTCSLLEQVRMLFLAPITITSGYRSKRVNDAVGGKETSQHRLGCAADFKVSGYTPDEVCQRIAKSGLQFDQLIREYNVWTHIGVPNDPERPCRGQVLIIDNLGTRPFIVR